METFQRNFGPSQWFVAEGPAATAQSAAEQAVDAEPAAEDLQQHAGNADPEVLRGGGKAAAAAFHAQAARHRSL